MSCPKKQTFIAIIVSTILIISTILVAHILSTRGAVNQELIEFEVIYSNVTAESFSEQFKYGDILYSPYITDDFFGGTRGLKEIGFAVGDFSGTIREGQIHKYRIFERTNYSIDEFIIVKDDGFMNPATIYVAT